MQPQATSQLQTLLDLAARKNLCAILDEDEVGKIGRECVRLAKQDDESRADWKKKNRKGMDLALQVVEEKTNPWPGASNVKHPIITVAAIQFHARAYGALVAGNRVVKTHVTGEDPSNQKAARARRVAEHMNWQLLFENADWEEEFDNMLLALPIEGCEFKKSYFSKDKGYNVSEWVRPEDLIVDTNTKSLETCPRITHRLYYYPHEIDTRVRAGIWKDEDLDIDVTERDEEVQQEFYEQHTFLDLDGDGYKEPYIVTVHVASERVVRIVAGFFADDIRVELEGQEGEVKNLLQAGGGMVPKEILAAAKVVKVPRIEMFTRFIFLPSPDGSFYGLGFGQLIGPLSDSIDTNINQLIDAGTLANMQAGFYQAGVSMGGKQGPIKFERGEFKPLKLPAGASLNNAIYQLRFPEPSMVLFNLLGLLIQSAKDITSVQDIMTGAPGVQGEKATTSSIRIEQGLKAFSSIFKRIYRAMYREFKVLYHLNSKFLKPEQYFTVLDSNDPGVVRLLDYQGDASDIQPVADPQLSSSMIAALKYQSVMQVMSHPLVNDEVLLQRFFEANEIPNPGELIIPQESRQAPPDPELVLKAQIAASEHSKRVAEIAKLYAEALDKVADAESKEIGTQLQIYAEQLRAVMQGMANGQGSNPQMAQLSGGAGISESPQGSMSNNPGGFAGQV